MIQTVEDALRAIEHTVNSDSKDKQVVLRKICEALYYKGESVGRSEADASGVRAVMDFLK